MRSFTFSQSIKLILWLLVASLLVAFAYELINPRSVPIKYIKIEGSYEHITHEQIKDAALPLLHSNFLSLPVDELKNALTKLPWVRDAIVNRVWPDTIVIHIVEEQAVGRWNNNGLLNDRGVVFFPDVRTISPELPWFDGPPGQAANMLAEFTELSRALAQRGILIKELHLTDRWSWWLKLNNGMILLLGREDLSSRMARFIKSYNNVFGSNGASAKVVDLRYAHGMSVRWEKDTSQPE